MNLTLYYHPFSSYCQKALIALYEAGVAFEPRVIDLGDPEDRAALQSLWPFSKFPVLRDAAREKTIPESSLIVAYVDRYYGGPVRLIPEDFDAAIGVHLMDRVIDDYLLDQVTKVVVDTFRPEGAHDQQGVEEAKARVAQGCSFLEDRVPEQGWIGGAGFTLADCAAAPALFYAGTVAPFHHLPKLSAYYERLIARPSVARALDEARPYRHLFPLPWPESYA